MDPVLAMSIATRTANRKVVADGRIFGSVSSLPAADTGQGVTPEVKEKLFLPYFSTKRRGTGLGLAIVSRIIEDHHGSIRVEENSPVGTRFIVELPVAQEVMVEVAAG